MKAAVLYSGGKDSSFVAVMLERLGLDNYFTASKFKAAKCLFFNVNYIII